MRLDPIVPHVTHHRFGLLVSEDHVRKHCWIRLWVSSVSVTVEWWRPKYGESKLVYSRENEFLRQVVARRMLTETLIILHKED